MKNTEIMTDKEITLSLKLFKKAMSKNAITYTHADPIEQNCYISSAGAIIGVYFPNTQFSQKLHPSYNICSLSKVGGVLGVVFALSDEARERISKHARLYFEDYIFASFDSLIYSPNYKEIEKRIEQNLNAYQKDLQTLLNVKRVYKKNGDPFARLLDNYTGSPITVSYSLMDGVPMSLKIGGCDYVYIYRDNEKTRTGAPLTLEEIDNLIEEKRQHLAQCVATQKLALKHLEKDFEKFEKICKTLKTFLNSVEDKYAFKSRIDNMIL